MNYITIQYQKLWIHFSMHTILKDTHGLSVTDVDKIIETSRGRVGATRDKIKRDYKGLSEQNALMIALETERRQTFYDLVNFKEMTEKEANEYKNRIKEEMISHNKNAQADNGQGVTLGKFSEGTKTHITDPLNKFATLTEEEKASVEVLSDFMSNMFSKDRPQTPNLEDVTNNARAIVRLGTAMSLNSLSGPCFYCI